MQKSFMALIPGLGKSHMQQSNQTHAATTEPVLS